MSLLLDISRTVARARLPAPTGIDRVERAYIEWALPRGSLFICHVDGRQLLVPSGTVRTLLDWLDGTAPDPALDSAAMLRPTRDQRLRRAQSLIRREAIMQVRAPLDLSGDMGGRVYLNVGHDNLSGDWLGMLTHAGIPSVVMIHDVIPLEYPQFARAGTLEKFRRKIDAASQATALIANSEDTCRRVKEIAGVMPDRILVAPLGIPERAPPSHESGHHFVCLGTIEPRKNHAMLLDIWRELGADAPVLHLVGRRGWRNDAVFSTLDAAPMMGATVFEHAGLPDDRLDRLLSSARALLFPSFAEGFGLPLAEALDLGCPVIASDLPALREVGGDVPIYLSPSDAAGWKAAIRAFADEPSQQRATQLDRLALWRAPRWSDHFWRVEKLLETILVQAGVER